MIEQTEQSVLSQIVERLARKYPAVESTTVSAVVHDVHAKFEGRPVRDFVPLFVERNAKRELGRLTVG